MRVRCWSDAVLSSSADWARLRKPRTLHGYKTPQTGRRVPAFQNGEKKKTASDGG